MAQLHTMDAEYAFVAPFLTLKVFVFKPCVRAFFTLISTFIK